MTENQFAKNILYYRKKRGLSQEKVAEYMGVSRQAVTKWENNISKPSSDHLIKLAQLLEVPVDLLLNTEEAKDSPEELSTGKMPWIFIGISAFCILGYIITSTLLDLFSIGTFICMFVLCVPIQLFLHIYLSNAVKNNSFDGIAGFDNTITYHIYEVKKLLIQINLHIGIMSTVYIFLLCMLNCINLTYQWLNGTLIVVYLLNVIANIVMINYKMADKIYREDCDKIRAKRSMPVTVIYVLLLFVGIGITGILFKRKGIENNTLPAIKHCGLLLLGILSATAGFLLENSKIKKWNPANEDYKISKICIICFCICIILYGLMCVI